MSATRKRRKPEAHWVVWGGIDCVTIGERPNGRPHAVLLVRQYAVFGSEREARKVVALCGGGTMMLRTGGRELRKVTVPGMVHPTPDSVADALAFAGTPIQRRHVGRKDAPLVGATKPRTKPRRRS